MFLAIFGAVLCVGGAAVVSATGGDVGLWTGIGTTVGGAIVSLVAHRRATNAPAGRSS